MTREEARTALSGIVSATTAPVLSTADLDRHLDAALVVDADGLAPVEVGYVETFDLDYAAAEAFEDKAVRAASAPVVEEFSAEGARFKRQAPDFAALAAHYRARSSAAGGSGISVIELDPQTPDALRPRSAWG